MTIVEGAVAGLLLTIGALASLQVFDAAGRANYRAEESQTINDRLQAELEEVKQLPFVEVALTAQHSASSDPNDPRSRVSGSSFAVAEDGGFSAPLVVDAANGAVAPGPEPFQVGDVSGRIYKFVVWQDDPNCSASLCPGTQDFKRVVVAAKIDLAPVSYERAFQEVHTDVVDPDTTPLNNPAPEGEDQPNPFAQFWLTDTPCSYSTRQAITADHLTHNTRSRCSDGLHTGATAGAPDLMFTEAPALDPDLPADGQPMFDYATDSEPSSNASQDKGLLMPWSSTDSCLLQPVLNLLNLRKLIEGTGPLLGGVNLLTQASDGILGLVTGESNKHLRTHTWVSPKVQNDGGVLLTGKGSLELWTKTVNGAVHPGKICVSLFVRQEVTVPLLSLLGIPIGSITLTVDLPVVNLDILPNPTYFEYSRNPWPTNWTEVSVPLNFLGVNSTGVTEPLHLSEGSQIGLTIMTKKTGTSPGQALEFMYDHPSFESRLELETENILEF